MGSRDVWSHGSARHLRDLLASALATLLLPGAAPGHVYFSSPWMSDFVLYDNSGRQFGTLFPANCERSELRLIDYLLRLATMRQVRIMTTSTDASRAFVSQLRATQSDTHSTQLEIRFARSDAHEKGILTPCFCIDGSMNITYSGVYVRGEKVTYHTAVDEEGRDRIARAYLEYDRQWRLLE